MPFLKILMSFATEGTMPRDTSVMTSVSDEDIARLIPEVPTGGATGWPHWNEAEELVCGILKRRMFADEITPVEKADDLRKLGVWYLRATLEDEKGNQNMFTIMNDHPGRIDGTE